MESYQDAATRMKELNALLEASKQTTENIKQRMTVALVDSLVEQGHLKKTWGVAKIELGSEVHPITQKKKVARITTIPLTLSKVVVAQLESHIIFTASGTQLKGSQVNLWVRTAARPDGLAYEGWLEFTSLEDIKALTLTASTVDVAQVKKGGIGVVDLWGSLQHMRQLARTAQAEVQAQRQELEKRVEAARELDNTVAQMEEASAGESWIPAR